MARYELKDGETIKWIDIVSNQVGLNQSPPTGSNDTSIATTAWYRAYMKSYSCSNVVNGILVANGSWAMTS
jgi:hypothetical protein